MSAWQVFRYSKKQVRGDFFVARELPTGLGHFEQLRDGDGVLRQFASEADALAAIAEVTPNTVSQTSDQ